MNDWINRCNSVLKFTLVHRETGLLPPLAGSGDSICFRPDGAD